MYTPVKKKRTTGQCFFIELKTTYKNSGTFEGKIVHSNLAWFYVQPLELKLRV